MNRPPARHFTSLMGRNMTRYYALTVLAFLSTVTPAHAHAFAQRYDLPIPLWLYLVGAGATVAVSFVIVGIFVRKDREGDGVPRLELLDTSVGRVIAHRHALTLLRVLSVAIFIVLILAGLFGVQDDPDKNILPTAVWVIWWVGLAFASAILGDLWSLLNPWRIVAEWVASAVSRVKKKPAATKDRELPAHASAWPAVAVFVGFSWAELVWPGTRDTVQPGSRRPSLQRRHLGWHVLFRHRDLAAPRRSVFNPIWTVRPLRPRRVAGDEFSALRNLRQGQLPPQ